jgi:colanic acid/amylovoran biosynthesis protein
MKKIYKKLLKRCAEQRQLKRFVNEFSACADEPFVIQTSSALHPNGCFVNYGDYTMVEAVESYMRDHNRRFARLLREPLDPSLIEIRKPGLFLDCSGFIYSSTHLDKRSVEAANATLHNVKIFKAAGYKTIMAPQTLGPFEEELADQIKTLLNQFDKIYVRDEISKRHVLNLETISPNNVNIVPDTALAYKIKNKEAGRNYLEKVGLDLSENRKPIVAINLNRQLADRCSKYTELMAEFCNRLKGEYQFIALPHERGRGGKNQRDDQALALELSKQCGIHALLIDSCHSVKNEPQYMLDLEASLASMDFLIAGRFHATVRGLAENIPTITQSWSHKYETVYNQFNIDCTNEWIWTLEDFEKNCVSLLIDKFNFCFDRKHLFSQKLEANMPAILKQINSFFETLMSDSKTINA